LILPVQHWRRHPGSIGKCAKDEHEHQSGEVAPTTEAADARSKSIVP
jgi:hypothetical protein